MLNRTRCLILVPVYDRIERACEESLQAAESLGYSVRRQWIGAAIDAGRSAAVTRALDDGYDEIMWVDSDIAFEATAIDRIREHGQPIVCGLYPKKAEAALAHQEGVSGSLTFGAEGLREIVYAAAGFLYTRREVYERIRDRLGLPVCNETFGDRIIPYFLPQIIEDPPDRHWYLAEDYSFCHRARQVGFQIWADPSIRLWHVGSYAYSWEDCVGDRPRYPTLQIQANVPSRPKLGATEHRLWLPRGVPLAIPEPARAPEDE